MDVSIADIDLTCKVHIGDSGSRCFLTPKFIPLTCDGLCRHVFGVASYAGDAGILGIGLMDGACDGWCSVCVQEVDVGGSREGGGWVGCLLKCWRSSVCAFVGWVGVLTE